MGMMQNDGDVDSLSYNKRSMKKWEQDEALGDNATISPVLYANLKHPELKTQYTGKMTSKYQLILITNLAIVIKL
jgi:histone-lysine N-methyltransferase MLL3